MANSKPGTYDESSIRVLKGLEPVRLRPGQFTRTDTPLHIVQEAIDNAVDEAIGGHAKLLAVTLHADGSVERRRRRPRHSGRPAPDREDPGGRGVFTLLHAGGKFDKTSGAGAYAFSGGLHGVGVSVTNALSTRLEVRGQARGQAAPDRLRRRGRRREARRSRARRPGPAPRCGSGRTRSTSTRRSCRRTSSRSCCAPRPCCCRASGSRSPSRRRPAARRASGSIASGLAGYPGRARAGRAAAGAGVRRREPRDRERRDLRRGRRRRLGVQLVRERQGRRRVLRQPDPDAAGRHPRVGPAQRRVRGGERVHRPPQPAAAAAEAAARTTSAATCATSSRCACSTRSSRGRPRRSSTAAKA